jgi:hypothetical protein
MARKSVMPTIVQNFLHDILCHHEDEQNCEGVELQGHIDCSCTFMKFLNVTKSVQATGDKLGKLGQAKPGFVHVIDEEGKTEHMATSCPTLLQSSFNGGVSTGCSSRTVDAANRIESYE